MKKEINEYLISEISDTQSILKWKCIYFLSWIKSILPTIKRHFIKLDIPSKKYNVAVCSIFKNEAPYLKEWILFNHIAGVDHFYLYNNNSEDNYKDVLSEFIDSGLVTLNQWEKNQAQIECYKDGISKYAKECKWLGFIDIDEFIVPKSTNDIYSFLREFEKNTGAVKIYWKMYGTSGKIDRKLSGLVTEDFTVSWPKYYDVGKCFYNTAFEFNFNSKKNNLLHHNFWASYKGREIPPVNVFNHVCIGTYNKLDSLNVPMQINHYFTKSYSEYAAKRTKGDVYFKKNPHDLDYFFNHEYPCTSLDYSAFKFLIQLKRKMNIRE